MKQNGKIILVVTVAVVAFVVAFVISFVGSASGARFGGMSLSFWIMLGSLAAVTVGIVMALKNNRSVPMASDGERQTALSSCPPADRGRLLVYREGFVGKLAGFDVLIDGQVVAQLKSPRFVSLDLPTGAHEVAVIAQNKRTEPLHLTLTGGAFAVVRVGMPIGGGATLEQELNVDAARAKLATIQMVRPDGHGAEAVFA